MGKLASPASAFHFFLSRPWLHQFFHQQDILSCWNLLRWTQKFPHWPWKGCRWIPWMSCPCTASWTATTEWSVPHWSSVGLLPNILWGGLKLRQGVCSWYSRVSALPLSQRTSQLVLDSLQFQSVLFDLGGWPNCPCVVGWSCSAGINRGNQSTHWGPFTGYPSSPCATEFFEAWRPNRAFYLWRCYNNTNNT